MVLIATPKVPPRVSPGTPVTAAVIAIDPAIPALLRISWPGVPVWVSVTAGAPAVPPSAAVTLFSVMWPGRSDRRWP